MLPKFVDNMELRLEQLDHSFIDRDTLETSDVTGGGMEQFLYQTGYLTIKDFDDDVYTLGFPNEEVKRALYRVVVKEAAAKQIADRNYTEPFKADKRKVVGLAVELDSEGKGLVDWKVVDEIG